MATALHVRSNATATPAFNFSTGHVISLSLLEVLFKAYAYILSRNSRGKAKSDEFAMAGSKRVGTRSSSMSTSDVSEAESACFSAKGGSDVICCAAKLERMSASQELTPWKETRVSE
ncbi:hypothetical protein LTR66_005928 [Elasticomyces elasticus]|nr:hypothetical protein LTR66_005928 [Elasticomyces elasticus]